MKKKPTPRPVIKYAGGKTRLLPEILPRLPDRMRTYFEPFIGGGAVFFALAREGRFDRAVIGDRNRELVELYTAIRDDVEGLLGALRVHQAKHAEAYFRTLRDTGPLFRVAWSPIERAARTLYLNRACFNGLHRENRRGDFNVAWGKHDVVVFDEENLRACAVALRGVDIRCSDFADTARDAGPGDGVFFDPPYLYPEDAENFTGYIGLRFTQRDHVRLAGLAPELAARGVHVLISNDDNVEVRRVYGGLELVRVEAPRSINRNADGRGPVPETLAICPPRAVVEAAANS